MNDADCALSDFVAELWQNLEERLDSIQADPLVKMHTLGVFQRNAEAFGFERKELGLPGQDAEILFINSMKS